MNGMITAIEDTVHQQATLCSFGIERPRPGHDGEPRENRVREAANQECARIVLADPERYGGEVALMVHVRPPGGRTSWNVSHGPRGTGLRITRAAVPDGDGMNPCEVYKLSCHQCGHAVELPAGAPNDPQHHACPRYGTSLFIDWRGDEPPRTA